jgi:CPA1 family monovalent cation:H+ antiporter
MEHASILIAGLLVAAAGLSALARRLDVPYPIVLVIGGALFGFVPGLPEVRLAPEVVLVVFLPPLLYGESIFANFADFKANLRSLVGSTVALVLATMCAVAWAGHELAGLPWPAAFVLGAVVSPTDPIAAAAIMRRLGVPRRILSSIEGEGLFNDATALVAYRVAVVAVVAGSFSLAGAGLRFLLGAAGGVAIGLLVGWVSSLLRARAADAQISVTLSLLTGYAAFVPADAVGASGVLAVVTAGIFMGIRGPDVIAPQARLQGYFVWNILDFVVNAILFVLVGLQLRAVVEGLSGYPATTLAGYGLAVAGLVAGTRLVFYFTVPYLIRLLDRRPSQRARRVNAQWRLVLGWSGMRGSVSLAVALALPLTTDAGDAFPGRDLIIFLTFAVIFFSLVVQGLSLPVLIRRLGVGEDGGTDAEEEVNARLVAARAALARIDELGAQDWTRPDTVERMRAFYEYRTRRFAARAGEIDDDGFEDRTRNYQRMVHAVIAAQRDALVELRRQRRLSNEALNRILRELDLEELRLEP